MKLESSGGIGVMSIDTDRNNAINLESIAEAHELMDEAEHDSSIRALVVTAEHPDLFCPGVDIVSLVDADRPTMDRFFAELSGLVRRKFSYPLPEVYALGGHTVAAGFMMAAAGDFRILCGQRSKVGLMEVDLGLAAPIGVVQMLVHVFGGRTAEELLSFGQLFGPERAGELGIVDELVDDRGVMMERALSVAGVLAAKPPGGYQRIKRYARGETAAAMERLDKAHNAELVEQWFDPETQRLVAAAVDRMGR